MNDASEEYRHRICRAMDYINSHLADNPSVADIAQAAPFSSFHFQRLFRAIVGETVAEFTRRLRLETAARHLRYRPKIEITDLAFELGFSSSQNFAKAFKKHFAVSPTEYRRDARDELAGGAIESISLNYHHVDIADSAAIDALVDVRQLPAVDVVYRRHMGSYNDPGVQAVFDDLVRWSRPRGLDVFDRYLGIPWDDATVTPDRQCRFDACLIVPEEAPIEAGVNRQTIPGGRYAVFATEVVDNDFDLPWTQLMRDWLPRSGYQPADGPRFEVYHSDGKEDPEGRWKIDVCLPVMAM